MVNIRSAAGKTDVITGIVAGEPSGVPIARAGPCPLHRGPGIASYPGEA